MHLQVEDLILNALTGPLFPKVIIILRDMADRRCPGISVRSEAKHFRAFFITKFTYSTSFTPNVRL